MQEQHRANSSESSTEEQPNPSLDIGEFLSLKHDPTNYWAFVCTYCSKSFPSSQSLGGHQNAHRRERNEERRLYIKNPLAYRKQALLLRSVMPPPNVVPPPPRGGPNIHLPVAAPPAAKPRPLYDPSRVSYRQRVAHSYLNDVVDWKKPKLALDLNLPPTMELTVHGAEEDNNSQRLDLTLKL